MTRLSTSAVVRSESSCPRRSVVSMRCAYCQPAHGRISVSRLISSNLARSDMSDELRLKCRRELRFVQNVCTVLADRQRFSCFLPAIAHSVHGFDAVEARIDRLKLAADAFDMGGDRVVVEDDIRGIH